MTTVRTRPTVDYDRGLKHCSFCDQWLTFEKFSPSPHKNGGCGLKSYCKDCDKVRYPYKPRENPKVQPKQHIFDIFTREELRQCSQCCMWSGLPNYFMHGRFRSNLCKPCERANARERARVNVEEHVAAAKRWAAANPEKIKARRAVYNQRWALKDPSRLITRRIRLRDYMRVKSKTPEYLAQQRDWSARNGNGAEKRARRRALMMGATVDRVERWAIIKRDKRICYLCGKHLLWREVTLDHVIPLARGGSHTAANLRVACGPCNFSKQDRLLGQLALI